jgi:hypothetical protein
MIHGRKRERERERESHDLLLAFPGLDLLFYLVYVLLES